MSCRTATPPRKDIYNDYADDGDLDWTYYDERHPGVS